MKRMICMSKSLWAICVVALLLSSLSFAGCSKRQETTYEPIESDRYAKLLAVYDQDEPVLKLDDKVVTWQEYCYCIAYHVAYVEDDHGTVENWNDPLDGKKTYAGYVLENAEKWVLYDMALENGAAETGVALDAKDEAGIEKQWDEAVKSAGSEEALLEEMSTYCCNKALYCSMLRTQALSAKVFKALYGDAEEDMDAGKAFEEKLDGWAKNVSVERLKDVSNLDLQKLI